MARVTGIACFASSFAVLAMVALCLATRSQEAVSTAGYVGATVYCGTYALTVTLIIAAASKLAPKGELKPAFQWMLAGNASFLVQSGEVYLWAKAMDLI